MTTPFPFVAAQTLTAAQMNAITTLPVSTKTASYILTVADVGYRIVMNSASATTITVNTSIFGASDKVEILNIGAGVCTVTAGTCTVGTSGTLALVQNAGGTLTFISASASVFIASGSAASGLVRTGGGTLSGASTTIAANMSATYNTYLVDISNLQNSTGSTMTIQLDLSGTPSTTGYTRIGVIASGSGNALSDSDPAWDGQGMTSAAGQGFQFLLTNPALATPTKMSVIQLDLGTPRMRIQACNHTVATAFNQIKIIAGGGTFTTGTVNVYGYALS